MTGEPPTWVACLTPPGSGAIGVVALRGPRAWSIVRQRFQPFTATGPALPEEPQPGSLRLGRFGIDVADDVVVAVVRGGPSPWLEIQGHGGDEAVRLLMDACVAGGAQLCTWDDLEARTADDADVARATFALAQAVTTRTATILLDQVRGAFVEATRRIVEHLDTERTPEAIRELEAIGRRTVLGRHLTTPWKVAVLGPPNVGKSSLVNALAGYQRSIVAPTPGTTRDVVTTRIAVDGWPVELSDTAGLREEGEALEEQGMQRARDAAAEADLCLWLLDASEAPVWPEPAPDRCLFVINKIDLASAWHWRAESDAVAVSARDGRGLPELLAAVARWLVPETPAPGTPVPIDREQAEKIDSALRCCRAGDIADAKRILSEPLKKTGS